MVFDYNFGFGFYMDKKYALYSQSQNKLINYLGLQCMEQISCAHISYWGQLQNAFSFQDTGLPCDSMIVGWFSHSRGELVSECVCVPATPPRHSPGFQWLKPLFSDV